MFAHDLLLAQAQAQAPASSKFSAIYDPYAVEILGGVGAALVVSSGALVWRRFRKIRSRDSAATIRAASKMVCDLQGHFAEYSVVGLRRYNELCRDLKALKDTGYPTAREAAVESKQKLKAHMLAGIRGAFDTVQKGLGEHFGARRQVGPRFGITMTTDHGTKVIHMFPGRTIPVTPIDEHTSYSYFRTRQPNDVPFFLCNDIPGASRKGGEFKHPRLRADAAHYREPGWLQRKWRKFDGRAEDDWSNYWIAHDPQDRGRPHAFKSNLVVPVGFENNHLADEVKTFILKGVDFEEEGAPAINVQHRAPVFGFLCLDHGESHYFDSEVDPPLLFLAADLLSLFLLYRRLVMHTPTLSKLGYDHVPDHYRTDEL